MALSIYHVSITEITGEDDSAGFVDNTKIENYSTDPQSEDACKDKERANIRFLKIVDHLQMMGNMDIVNIVATGADATTPPSEFEFDLSVDKGDSILLLDDDNDGEYLTGADAIKRAIARALVAEHTKIAEIRTNTKQFFIVEPIQVGSLGDLTTVSAHITVTKTL